MPLSMVTFDARLTTSSGGWGDDMKTDEYTNPNYTIQPTRTNTINHPTQIDTYWYVQLSTPTTFNNCIRT